MAEPKPTPATPALPAPTLKSAIDESDSDDGPRDVEIELELPQYKIDELLAQLQDEASSLKAEFPLAHVAAVSGSGHRPPTKHLSSAVSQAFGDSAALRNADQWDPLTKLAQFKHLQSRYAAVKEQMERAESTKRILQQVPCAGASTPVQEPDTVPELTPPEFPPPGGLPFPYCGVPGVLSPRAKPPPDPSKDFTDGDWAYEAVKEIIREEGPSVHTRMTKEEVMLAKDGMDMTLNHLRTTGSRMVNEVRELERKMDEAENLAEVQFLAQNEPELQDELVRQQRLIHEQQRLADEARLELELEKERAFWNRRDKILQPEEVDDFKLEGDPIPYPAAEDELIAASRVTSNRYPAMRHMMPELAPEGAGPMSRYRLELPASREYHGRVAYQAAELGWPSPAEALAIENLDSPKHRSALTGPNRSERSPIREPEPGPSPRSPGSPIPPAGGFFAGYRDPRDRGFETRGGPQPRPQLDDADELDDPVWEAVDVRGRPLAPQVGKAWQPPAIAAFSGFDTRDTQHSSALVEPPDVSEDEYPGSYVKPAFAAFAGEASRSAVDFFGSSDRELTASPRREPEEEQEQQEFESEEEDEEEYEEEGYFGSLLTGAGITERQPKAKAPIDPSARFMAGACMTRNPPLEIPKIEDLHNQGLKAVDHICEVLLQKRQDGQLGDPDTAKLALDYVVAVALLSEKVVATGDAWKHVGIITDILHFFPLCAHIHLWSLEALMSMLRHEDNFKADSLARPVFDSVTDLMKIHLEDRALRTATPELPTRLLASIALAITPDNVRRLTNTHVDFALTLMKEPDVYPLTTEHGLQIIVLAASTQNLRAQTEAAKFALRCFKAEPRLVPRALLALSTTYNAAAKGGLGGTILVKEPSPTDAIEPESEQEGMVPIAFRDITTTMDVYAKDRKIQGAGARALESAMEVTSVSLKALVRDGLLRSVSLAHQRFPESRSVALALCRVIGRTMLREPDLVSPEVGIAALSAGASLPRDAEVVVASLEAVYVLAPKLRGLWSGVSTAADRLALVAGDLVRLGEVRHKDSHSVGMLLVIITCVCSDGHGQNPGGISGERWRLAFGRAAGVAVPLRALFEYSKNLDMVTAAGIALRCLTYGTPASCAHAARARAGPVLLSSLIAYASKPATTRELLAALANCASEDSLREDFKKGLPQTAEVIYNAMEQSADREPDVLAQGCRAFGALYSSRQQDINLGLKPGEKPKQTSVVQWAKLNSAIMKTVIGITVQNGGAVEGSALEVLSGSESREQKLESTRRQLGELCMHLANGSLAAGPQFGRLLSKGGQPTAECTPRWSSVRLRLQARAERRKGATKEEPAAQPMPPASDVDLDD